ncbi:Tricarboxylate transport transcriptional regulator TctD [Paramagnetospirillum magnetotacticum MS-1]|uniref:Tricarboxylate transport transcriptional regulator TctD n=1 Tax=Paramagnetospirillum magnetotacticum MS-1 TaxID=272627 RepID=A0A0C2Z078_PARME|nr:response regulator transcription factor [Paramagnetospirillum magnetotacticum]KIM00764.1 Tricarboxylate transport transcriptional regulator TctD [Paramagnetospirillum magnetotacticum MS-1]
MRILLVEDNDRLAEFISGALKSAGFVPDVFGNKADAIAAFESATYQAAILDLGLPDGDGLDIIRAQRAKSAPCPMMVLTARDGVSDRVSGLNAGADDYLLKPFAMEELIARLRAILRRPGAALSVELSLSNLTFDTTGREVRVDGTLISMPRREMEMLEHLLRRAGKVVSKRSLEEGLYGFDDDVTPNSVEVLVSRLRKRLQQTGARLTVHTLRGIGYMLADGAP